MHRLIGCAVAMLLLRSAAAQTPVAAEAVAARYAIAPSAVAAALLQAGLSVAATQVYLPGVLSARTPTPTLKITGTEQRSPGQLEVRIGCQNPAECLPFFARIDGTADPDALAIFAAKHLASAKPAAARPGSLGVAVGDRVRLQLTDAQMRIDLPAIAIDTGAPGTEVRVSSPDRKHTWRAVVVDASTVRGGLQ